MLFPDHTHLLIATVYPAKALCNGIMQRLVSMPDKWFYADGKWFYADGKWFYADGKWFYADDKWFYVDGKWFYAAGNYRL